MDTDSKVYKFETGKGKIVVCFDRDDPKKDCINISYDCQEKTIHKSYDSPYYNHKWDFAEYFKYLNILIINFGRYTLNFNSHNMYIYEFNPSYANPFNLKNIIPAEICYIIKDYLPPPLSISIKYIDGQKSEFKLGIMLDNFRSVDHKKENFKKVKLIYIFDIFEIVAKHPCGAHDLMISDNMKLILEDLEGNYYLYYMEKGYIPNDSDQEAIQVYGDMNCLFTSLCETIESIPSVFSKTNDFLFMSEHPKHYGDLDEYHISNTIYRIPKGFLYDYISSY